MIKEFVVRGRQQGKSHYLAAWVKGAANRVILVHTHQEAQWLCGQFDLKQWQVRTLNQWSHLPPHLKREKEVALDNVDFILDALVGAPVSIASINSILVAEVDHP